MLRSWILSAVCLFAMPLAAIAEDWNITLTDSEWSAGRFNVIAIVQNNSGQTLYDCTCTCSVSSNAVVEFPSKYDFGQIAHGESVRCVFTVYDASERETTYDVSVTGYTEP